MRSSYLLDSLVDKVLLLAPFEVSIHTADPGDDGAAEVAGYREPVTLAAAAIGELVNSAPVELGPLPAGTYTHMGLWGSGRFLMGIILPRAQTLEQGQAVRWGPSDIVMRFD